ncbi:hypothetical protein [Collinsella aerofaciens]|uniref:hypothetical protein n=1 Tax=Collinsella aerofaciens TaxID=74426 RepID=UPI001D011E0F|nr:hypothetical protein [Collinsella aerofaciens]MCB5366930.1 hypothetical protein [Collinsella aerofaciens]MCB5368972.1 hypothetical protein [Collinsella aerofaciens]
MSFLKHLLPTWKTSIDDKTKANAAILSAIDTELKDSEADAISTSVLMSLDTATGEWLDQYGNIFGVIRQDDEEDNAYRERIKSYILLERGTIPAIMDAIRNFLQDTTSYINIYEPYNNIFFLNKSKLNSYDSLLGEYYTVAVIDVQFTNAFPIAIGEVISKFKPAGVSVHMTRKPKAFNPNAETFMVTTTDDPIQKAKEIQANRDSTYLSIGNSDIIGYKRIYKMILARPLAENEDVNNPPYPIIYYGNKPWCLVPADNAEAEGARWVYISAKLEGEDFPNQGYSNVNVYLDLVPTGDKKPILLPSEVQSSGTLLLSDTRDQAERNSSVTVEEEFMIEVQSA